MKYFWQLCFIGSALCFSANSFAEMGDSLEPAVLNIKSDSLLQENVSVLAEKDTLQKQNETVLAEKDTLQDSSAVFSVEQGLLEERGKKDKEEADESRAHRLVKHEYGKRNKVGLAIGMMAFLAIIMTTSQQWNPD